MYLLTLFKKWWPWGKKNKKIPNLNLLSHIERIPVPANEVIIGMYVTELDRPWLETSFNFQGFEIKTEVDLKQIKDTCDFVYIDITKQAKPINSTNKAETRNKKFSHLYDQKPPPKKLGNVEHEIERADSIYDSTKSLVFEFMENAAKGEEIDTKLAKQAVAECVNSVLHSPDAILWLSQLKNKDEYTSQHSMNVCILSIVLGRHINLSVKELNNLGLCGMMHDMGKMLVPLEVLNKPGKLDPDELIIMQSHASLGHELLKSSPNMYSGAIDVAYSHHERLDGAGYPRRISDQKISAYTRMVAITDMYDALTSDRVYQEGMTHLEAVNLMSNVAGGHLDTDFVIKFIESIGVYPPGALVRLNNGEVAIVVEVNDQSRLRPKIIILLDEEKNKVPEKILDLNEMVRNKYGQLFTIKGIVRAQDYGIDAKQYYQRGFVEKGFAAVK